MPHSQLVLPPPLCHLPTPAQIWPVLKAVLCQKMLCHTLDFCGLCGWGKGWCRSFDLVHTEVCKGGEGEVVKSPCPIPKVHRGEFRLQVDSCRSSCGLSVLSAGKKTCHVKTSCYVINIINHIISYPCWMLSSVCQMSGVDSCLIKSRSGNLSDCLLCVNALILIHYYFYSNTRDPSRKQVKNIIWRYVFFLEMFS